MQLYGHGPWMAIISGYTAITGCSDQQYDPVSDWAERFAHAAAGAAPKGRRAVIFGGYG